jgi:hypothetical protein
LGNSLNSFEKLGQRIEAFSSLHLLMIRREVKRSIHVWKNAHFVNGLIFHIQEDEQRHPSALIGEGINSPNEMLAFLADRPTNDDADETTVFQAKPRPPSPSSPHNRDLGREHDLNLVNQFFTECLRPAA